MPTRPWPSASGSGSRRTCSCRWASPYGTPTRFLSVNVYLETHVFGEFKLGHGVLGPTEARVLLIVLNTAIAILGPLRFRVIGLSVHSV